MAALRAGKHVFCEKPLAANIHQGKSMIIAAEQVGRLLAVNFEMRAGHFYRKAKSVIASGEIGRVRFIRMVYNWAGPRWAGDNRHQIMMTEGMGPVVDCGVHFFDLARWFTSSNFRSINAAGINIEKFPNPDHVVATCIMENDTLVIVDESWVFGHTAPLGNNYLLHRTDIEGEAGTITIERSSFQSPTTFRVQTPQGVRTESTPEVKPFDQMYSLFVQSVKEGRLVDLASGSDGAFALAAALAALRSTQTKPGASNQQLSSVAS
jgi:myo-inositol 2-dehydrogenase/D-chiro-inositol 1-dehydrogenase